MSVATQLASSNAPALWLIEAQFASGTMRFSNWNHNLSWQGHTWLGLSVVVGFGKVVETEEIAWPAMEISLNLANPAMLALARGPASEYRRRELLAYLCVLDDELRVIDEPDEPYWAGLMDQMRLNTGDGKSAASVVLRCERPGRDNRYALGLRLNDAQHQARYPGDTGLSRMEQLVGKEVPWLSVKFQRR